MTNDPGPLNAGESLGRKVGALIGSLAWIKMMQLAMPHGTLAAIGVTVAGLAVFLASLISCALIGRWLGS